VTLAPWILLLAFAVTAATTPLAAVFGRRWGLVDHPGARKIHKAPMPRSGGIALYAGIVIAVQTFWMMGFLSREATATLPGIAFGALIVFLVGVIDDRYGVRVPVKFLGQFLAAGVLVLFEVKVSVFIKDHEPNGPLDLEGMMAKSSNIGMAKLGLRLGAEKFHRAARAFGFGSTFYPTVAFLIYDAIAVVRG